MSTQERAHRVGNATSARTLLLFAAVFAFAAGCDTQQSIEQPPASASIAIDPVAQQTELWCWAATVEMVLRHYGAPNLNEGGDYQCGIVAVYALISEGAGHPCTMDCRQCVEPINGMPEVERLVEEYGRVARSEGMSSPILRAASVPRRLTLLELMQDISAGRPIIAAVSSNGQAFPDANDHVVVLSGYDVSGDTPLITVNDPYPYDRFVPESQNPYVIVGGRRTQEGQYEIALQAFVERFGWAASLYRVEPA
jgi:hypothetical protein